ncbi:MAG: sulfotransferase [Flavobacteriales bacterium]|nr:sulfotransferase [Flavobacteriales bacterium]MCB9203361.1 sulfotransferase [Flavobacteriales bacterium]
MSENPQVKKRLYTRLMDLYRHNDIYIPGFNTLTRTILKAKAEGHVKDISVRSRNHQADIADWYTEKRLFFGYGVFRSGTTFLADFLNRHAKNAVVQHEANVNDYWFYAKAIHSDKEALSYISGYRLNEIYFRLKDVPLDVYGEINPFLRRHCKAIAEALPEAKQFHIVRDSRKVLRSLMSRELFDRKDPMGSVIYPNSDDPYSERWGSMNRFEKLCWLWSADNRFIRENTLHLIHFEKLRTDFDYFQEYVLDFLELEMNPDDWHQEIGKVYNSTPRYTFPTYKDWTAEQKQQFDVICGEEMSVYGY